MAFDPKDGEAGKRDGMDRAARSADPEWWAFMLASVKYVAQRQRFFRTDDLELRRQRRDGPVTHENRALGPLMREAQKLQYCTPTDRWEQSSQDCNHRRPMRVWRSLLVE